MTIGDDLQTIGTLEWRDESRRIEKYMLTLTIQQVEK